MPAVHRMSLAALCLGFTVSGVAWAEDAQDLSPILAEADWVESPYAPHRTWGPVVRVGTVVGFVHDERVDVTALGLSAGLGHRFGRFALETEYTYLEFQERGPSSVRLGDGHRLGVVGRLDVVRIGPEYVGGNSLVSLFVEGGAAVAWNSWSKPGYGEAERVVPEGSQRVEGRVGFGIEIDHRLQEPIGFPKRIGWSLGWRVGVAPHAAESAMICRSSGVACRTAPMMPEERYVDRSMLFQSTFGMMW